MLADTVRVTALELPARWGEPDRARGDVRTLLSGGPETDLVLLPEACLTGYVDDALGADLSRFAEPLDGPTVASLGVIAREHRVHLVGPLVLREGAELFNAMVALDPNGDVVASYRKRHPWYVETWATPGALPIATFPVRGVVFAVAICFDVHFLEEESARELEAADVLLFPSAWVEREDSRPEIFARIARRFGVAIVNANWGAGAPRMWGQGGSRIVGPGGELLAEAAGEGPRRVDARVSAR